METVAVIIPVYRPDLSNDERISFCRTLEIMRDHIIVIVCPRGFDSKGFDNLACKYDVQIRYERFDNAFFNGIPGYNRLLLSKSFYRRFKEFEYILICQLDAYVFKDELNDWCNKGYDYIGAPMFDDKNPILSFDGMTVGNGGFSLRRIQAFLDFFESHKNVFSPRQLVDLISLWKKPQTRIFVWILMCLGWRNKPNSVASRYKYNEDCFWSIRLNRSRFALNKPGPEEALHFAFERFPEQLYQLAHCSLPFGCHGWRKYQYDVFWKGIIP